MTEGINLLDTKGTLHQLIKEKSDGIDTKIVHTSHDLLKDIKTLEKADWTQIHLSPQAFGIGDRVYNRATSVLDETFKHDEGQVFP